MFLIRRIKNWIFKREMEAYQKGLNEMQQPIYASGYIYGFVAAKYGFPLERSKMAGYDELPVVLSGYTDLPDADEVIKEWERRIKW